MRKTSILAAGLSSLGVLAAMIAVPAQAGQHGRLVNVQGARGHGYVHSRDVSRQPGALSVSRGTQTNSGRGIASNRSASWGEGAYHGGATRTFNNGAAATRSTNVVDNHDGTVSYDHSRTGYDGATRSVSGTVSRP
ncbi:hypothetical protein [Caulobacter sp. UC70_42]|uniref:hypothetical protein n=1 Tax=Caulobacter sp. UC70_42 TaxID=3374551 RepID=UPI0037569DD8